jgi:hypothetical protein
MSNTEDRNAQRDPERDAEMNEAARRELADREQAAEGNERELGPEEQVHRDQAEEAAKGAGQPRHHHHRAGVGHRDGRGRAGPQGAPGQGELIARPQYRSRAYRGFKAYLAANVVPCYWCTVARALVPDHNPPVVLGGGDDDLVPACAPCNAKRAGHLGVALRRARARERRTLEAPWP